MTKRDAPKTGSDSSDTSPLKEGIDELDAHIDKIVEQRNSPATADFDPFDDDEDLPILDDVVLPGENFSLALPSLVADETSAEGADRDSTDQLITELRGIFGELHATTEANNETIEHTAAAATSVTADTEAKTFQTGPMEKVYQPHAIEQTWYGRWEAAGDFQPSGSGQPYCIMLPPPNVTGNLHMGHAFQDTLMDALVRYNRMLGNNTLWQCGTDHAGIATQMVVERQLAERNLQRTEIGRERFVEEVWKWKELSGNNITRQLRRMGSSMDWTRERFTLDEGLSKAVVEVFVQLYEQDLIYRGKRLVNWDPVLHTAISDLEVVAEEENGHMWHIRYPRTDGAGHVTVATTRPETMLGDVAVAVNPDDERYRSLIGTSLQLPLTSRQIPVIADDYVEMDFGSGCVKITPAHDFNDYEVGLRHALEPINIFTPSATLNENVPEQYQGMDRYEARKKIVADLDELGLLERTDDHKLMVPRGDRSQTVIEPYLTDQWFVRAAPLAGPAIEAVESGRIRFVPENWSKTYFEWMRNIQDWCISRQLWWGHRIPAWYDDAGQVYVGCSESEVRAAHSLDDDVALRQDEDVLDTWFSSGLWPFSTLGWPDETDELKTFYPGNVLVTGFDIIFFWVARMIMLGIKFMGDVPFREVYIHGLVRDADGQKMSKSKGNILDPIDLIDGIDLESLVVKRTTSLMRPQDAGKIEKITRKQYPDGIKSYGTDALRFTFASLATQGRDIRFDVGRIEGHRNFCNKLWNAARYVLMTLEAQGYSPSNAPAGAPIEFGLPERWIRARFQSTLAAVIQGFETYRFDLAAQAIHEFCWDEYCDWYLETSKIALTNNVGSQSGGDVSDDALKRGTCFVLAEILEAMLRLTHPLMPYITEEIWQRVAPVAGKSGASISQQTFPATEPEHLDEQAITEFDWLQSFVLGVRRIRAEMDIAPKKKLPVLVHGGSDLERRWLQGNGIYLQSLTNAASLNRIKPDAAPEAATALAGNSTILIPIADLIDPHAERERLQKEIQKRAQDLERIEAKLANANFVARAPEEVVAREQSRRAEQHDAVTRLQEQLVRIEKML
jgi:valyl-tRNA synthetase